MSRKGVVVGRSDLFWCIAMLGRASALALSDTLAQHGIDLLPESVIAQRMIVGKQGIRGCREWRRPRSELERVPDRGIVDRARSPPTAHTKSWSLSRGLGFANSKDTGST